MGVPETTHDTLRPASRSSLNESAKSTLANSAEPSVMEKSERPAGHPAETATAGSRRSSSSAGGLAKEIETTTEEAKVQTGGEAEEEIDDNEYPKSFKLALITIALCLSVFCMALGMSMPTLAQKAASKSYVEHYRLTSLQTTPSLPSPSRKLQINSRH